MAEIRLTNGGMTGELSGILLADDIQPGSELGYQTAKSIYEFHPLGEKLAKQPVEMAMCERREIAVPGAPEDMVVRRFNEVWGEVGADRSILNTSVLSRIYGVSALVVGISDYPTNEPLDTEKLRENDIYFNCADPLNAAGSLVMNQDATAPDFLKPTNVKVGGDLYHKSRSVVLLNDMPIFLGWTASAFGFSGRSVYQRSLYALKSYIHAMIADNMVARKCGLIVAKMQGGTSVANELANRIMGQKREMVRVGGTEDVLTIGTMDSVESLDLNNIAPTMDVALTHIKETIAAGAGMPALLVNQQTFAQGFGEGSEDAKQIAGYIDGIRTWMQPLYALMDRVVMARAWTPEFYATVQQTYPEDYGNVSYEAAVQSWRNTFSASWPSLIREPESKEVEVEKVRFEAVLSAVTALLPSLDPINKANMIQWVQDCLNASEKLIPARLTLDPEELSNWLEEQGVIGQQGDEGDDEASDGPKLSLAG